MDKNLPRECNRRIGRAMHAYDMLAEGDRVLAAVSGGVDSQVLVRVLHDWRRKAPIDYRLLAVHIDMEPGRGRPGPAAGDVRRRLAEWGIPLEIIPAEWSPDLPPRNNSSSRGDFCYLCARRRRKQLFDYARTSGSNKLALGHHRDDIIETFALNLLFGGNISTMVPRQDLFAGRLALIRPLSFVAKSGIEMIAELYGIKPVRTSCPLSGDTRRLQVRRMLRRLYRVMPEAGNHIFAALSNVRSDYLLRPAGGAHRNLEEGCEAFCHRQDSGLS